MVAVLSGIGFDNGVDRLILEWVYNFKVDKTYRL